MIVVNVISLYAVKAITIHHYRYCYYCNCLYDVNYRNYEQEKALIISLSDLLLLGKQTKQLIFSNLQQVHPIQLFFPSYFIS